MCNEDCFNCPYDDCIEDKLRKAERKEQLREYNKMYYQTHKEECAKRNRQYYYDHRDKMRECIRNWKKEHPEKVAEYNRKGYARRKEMLSNEI